MPKYWMITNRDTSKTNIGTGLADKLSFYVSDSTGDIGKFGEWKRCKDADAFTKLLVAAAQRFPAVALKDHERQKHVTLFVHGYNNKWFDAARRYQQITDTLYTGEDGLGICILFT